MNIRLILAAGILTCSAVLVQAHGDCAGLTDEGARLTCFDENHPTPVVVSPGPATTEEDTTKVAWRIDKDTNALTGKTDVFISVDANESIECGYNSTRPTLYLRCMDNTTAALLVTNCFMADIQGYGKVRYRVDDGKMKSRNFIERTDNMALGLWSYRRSRPFIDHLRGGERLIMEFTPYNDIPKQSTFEISGTDKALEPLRETCGW
jgi:type VI secretion system protein VasI